MPHTRVPLTELEGRLRRLREAMTDNCPEWRMMLLENKLDLYYFTGTMPDGVLVVTPGNAVLFVRRPYECTISESEFPDIRPMRSFRDIPECFDDIPDTVYTAENTLTLKKFSTLKKHLGFSFTAQADRILSSLRSVKSAYELECMRYAGRLHQAVIEMRAPELLRENVSEARLCAEICTLLLDGGAMGVSRFNSSSGEDVLGIASFGENTAAPSAMDTPSGTVGTSLAMKSIGSSERRLKKGELVLLDIPSGFRGYHTDKSISFFFGKLRLHPKGGLIKAAREQCVEIEKEAAKLLVPGAVPAEVYEKLCACADVSFREGFMNSRKFVGHSIGLAMDELPAIAKGFTEPVKAGMTFAVEPKLAIEGVGLVGSENTYEVVLEGPARSLTGKSDTVFEIDA